MRVACSCAVELYFVVVFLNILLQKSFAEQEGEVFVFVNLPRRKCLEDRSTSCVPILQMFYGEHILSSGRTVSQMSQSF